MRRMTLGLSLALGLSAGVAAQPQLLIPLTQPTRSMSGCAPTPAQPSQLSEAEQAAIREARQFRGPQLRGRRLAKAVKSVTALSWHESLQEAAHLGRAEGKPILWIQALGEIDGFT